MCGRFTLSTPASKLVEIFSVLRFPEMSPRYNIAPTQMVICIRQQDGNRVAIPKRWGLVPSWAKDLSIGNRMINARSETAAEKPSFRRAWKSRRCLIPADGFYEWEKLAAKKKQPWLIQAADRQPFAFAGLWERWRPKDSAEPAVDGQVVETCTILTTSANGDLHDIHDRMPVIIPQEHHATWLSDTASAGQLEQLVQPSPDGTLQRYRVSELVNKPSNDVPECLQPV